MAVVKLPEGVVERVKKRAEEQGLGLESCLIDVITRDDDPEKASEAYVEASKSLLEEARGELEKGDVRQAAEKLWGAAALAIKAYAAWREGKRLASHGELWRYKDVVAAELGEWVRDAWNAGNAMHVNFYEGWATREQVVSALKKVSRLVEELTRRVLGE
ncbi:MAG: PaREP1 family protein [Pyrobaculum sp.]|uniref:PaREP1 family protein n=1 Tax=Pyrobaculum sp. TaxID=2004705 RepID=UPI003162C07A